MGSLDAILSVQDLDTRADQLRHRRDRLPELELLRAAQAQRAEVTARMEAVAARLHELRAREKALEDEAALVEERAAAVDRKLYDGSVVAHRELEAFQADHRMLKQRQSQLEDEAIALMEEAEPVAGELAVLEEQAACHDAEIARLEAVLAEARAHIDAELAEVAAEREQAAAAVPPDVLAAYEPLRTRMGGVGAARLVGARCEGCHLEIPSAELEALRAAPADALVTCPECGRLLVR